MDSADQVSRLAKHLDEVPSLHAVFGADPQVVWMPSTHESDKRTLFVGLFIVEDALNRQAIASICSRTITELKAAKALTRTDGLEIMMCVARGETAEPVLRLSVLSQALASAELLTPDDLTKKVPAAGITCALYRRTLA